VQRKLMVGASDDPMELEADRTADAVVRALAGARPPTPPAGSGEPVGRVRRFTGRFGAEGGSVEGGTVDEGTERRLAAGSGGRPMAPVVRRSMEHAFGGADFASVRIHTGPDASELSGRLQARAFTSGRDVWFRDGMPDVAQPEGQRLVAHELTHVIQQGGAVVRRELDISRGAQGIQRQIDDPSELAALDERLRGECLSMGLPPDDEQVRQARQEIIDEYDNGDLGVAGIFLTMKLMAVMQSGLTTLSKDVESAATKPEALEKNRDERARVRQLIATGLASTPANDDEMRWKNTCEWITNRAGGTLVYVLTLAHDSVQRGNLPPGLGWYFPDDDDATSGDIYSTKDATYSDTLGDMTNLAAGETTATEAGTMEGRIIFYGSDRFSDEKIQQILVHEVQHVADKSADEVSDWKTNVPEQCMARYKTEFRAHWYERTFDRFSSTDKIVELGYEWTPRQYKIFTQIYGLYDHTRLAWDFSNVNDAEMKAYEKVVQGQPAPLPAGQYANDQVGDPKLDLVDQFRFAIVSYNDPDQDGANKFNSPRINAFYDLLRTGAADDVITASWITLLPEERAFVRQSKGYELYGTIIQALP
ncbi:MAG: hypothetical protein JWM12_1600, partial [Ilumatobacteraceae bacterium]|nr:hypothetical protein [Ilumatobacteraceae bacterium]